VSGPVRESAPTKKRRRGETPAEVRALADRRGVLDQLLHERRERRRRSEAPPDEREVAEGWLEAIRNRIASVVRCSLSLTEAEVSAGTIWLTVGRFDLLEPTSYATLGQALSVVHDDDRLTRLIHPHRMSQIRVVYEDPRARRGEGDSIVSKTGAWSMILSDLIGEILGWGEDDPDALTVRYDETTVSKFYVYFSRELFKYSTEAAWEKFRVQRAP